MTRSWDIEKKEIWSPFRSNQTSSFESSNDSAWISKSSYNQWYDSFRLSSFLPPKPSELDFDTTGMSSSEVAEERMARDKPSLSRRHMVVIAISSCVGTGLFIGSGGVLATGGPAALLIGFSVMGLALILTMHSTAELGLRFPTVSPFCQLTSRFMDPSWGFTVGWAYGLMWMVAAPLELIAAAMLSQYSTWIEADTAGSNVNPVAWVAILYAVEVFVHLFGGTRGYAELEFVIGLIKGAATLAWIIYIIVYVAGGIPNREYIGGHYFYDPGAFYNGFKGVAAVMVSAALAYAGTELTSIAAAESANPVRAIPSSTRQTFWRVVLFFVVAILLVGLSVPYDSGDLGSSNEGSGSPFVRALELAGTHALPTLMNAVIMCSVFGVSNAAIYGGARSLVALAISGNGPKILTYIDRRGRPLVAQLCMLTFALLCFVAASDKYGEVFNWLYAFVELSVLYAWASINICHIKFRLALRRQGRSADELLYAAPLGIFGSITGTALVSFVIGINFWTASAPPLAPGASQLSAEARVETFFQQDLSVPCVIIMFCAHKLYWKLKYGNWGFIKIADIDLDAGVRRINVDYVAAEDEKNRERERRNPLIRIFHVFC